MTDVLDFLERVAVPEAEPTLSVLALRRRDLAALFTDATPIIRPARSQSRTVLLTRREYTVDDEPVTHPGTAALEDLRSWLNLPLDAIVSLVGLAPSTRQWWRNHPNSPVRPGKAGKLLRLRNAAGLLIGQQGVERARATLHEGGWLTQPLDEARLVALEVTIRAALGGSGRLSPPPGLRTGASPLATMEPTAERELQAHEREQSNWSLGPEETP